MIRFCLPLLACIALPAAAQDPPRQTQSTTQRAPAPAGVDEAFAQKDYETAFTLLAPAVIACVKAPRLPDDCLDLLLVATNAAVQAKALDVAETLAAQAAKVADTALPDTDRDRLTAARNLAAVLDQLKRPEEALAWHRKALALADRQLPPAAPEVGAELAAIAAALGQSSDVAAREAILRRLLAWRERAETQNVATSRSDLALLLNEQRRYAEAEAEYAIAQRLFSTQLGADHQFTLTTKFARAANLKEAGRLNDALPLLLELAATPSPDEYTLRFLGRVQIELGDYPGSEASYRRAVEVLRAKPGADPGLIADSLGGIGTALEARGRFAEAEAVAREAAQALTGVAKERERYLRALNNVATAVMSQGRNAEAEVLFRDLAAMRRGGDPGELATVLSNMSLTLRNQGKGDAAAAVQREAIALRRANLPATDPSIALSLSILADLEEDRSGSVAALPLRREAYAAFIASAGRDHPLTAAAGQALALSLAYAKVDYPEVTRLLREARRVLARRLDPDAYDRIVSASYLATSLDLPGQGAEVRSLLRESTTGIQTRISRLRDFGPVAQREMRRFRPIFTQQVKADWTIAAAAKR